MIQGRDLGSVIQPQIEGGRQLPPMGVVVPRHEMAVSEFVARGYGGIARAHSEFGAACSDVLSGPSRRKLRMMMN